MTFRNEFPDFDYDLPVIDGFVDASWHNDTMPHMTNDKYDVWFDYADPAKREYAEGTRYQVTYADLDNGGIALLATDDFAEVLSFLSMN